MTRASEIALTSRCFDRFRASASAATIYSASANRVPFACLSVFCSLAALRSVLSELREARSSVAVATKLVFLSAVQKQLRVAVFGSPAFSSSRPGVGR